MSAAPSPDQGSTEGRGPKVTTIHRVGAVVVAVVIAVFGVLGLIGGLGFFTTTGSSVAGLSANGALSTISLVTAVILVVAAVRGGRLASTVMIVVGALFIISAFVNLWLIGTPENVLAFRLPNVFFSIVAGLVLLFLGAYGRVTGRPPDDNPYHEGVYAPQGGSGDGVPPVPTRADVDTDVALADATRAEATGTATAEQRRRLASTEEVRSQEDRRRVWESFDTPRPRADPHDDREGSPRS